MTARSVLGVLLAVLVLGGLTAAVASAVRAAADGRAANAAGATAAAGSTAATGPTYLTPDELPGLTRRPTAPVVRPVVPDAVRAPARTVASRALGKPNRGRLRNGVLFPAEGRDVTTWDAVLQAAPNRDWRRVGTDRLVRTVLAVARDHRRRNPGAPRVVVSDLSLPQGGRFGAEYGGLGHASHQNGLDVDIAYPRRDRRETGVQRVGQVDRRLAQSLVNGFVAAGAQFVFVGPRTGLKGPAGVVQPLANHDDHLHVRLFNAR